jgi:hypothetical protein
MPVLTGADQFNCEYSRVLGQPPKRDVRALRVADTGDIT